MCGKNGSIARQSQSNSLGKRVHWVGSKHARAAAATRTSTVFKCSHLLICNRWVGTFNHCSHQVGILTAPSACFHGATRTENRWNIQSHSRHKHARRHLVAVGNTNHCIRLVCIDHVFHGVGNDVPRGQWIEHTVVSHSNSVVNSNRIELRCIATKSFYLVFYNLTNVM